MQEVATLTLTMMLTISGWYHNGLRALQNRRYEQAIGELTKVYEKDVPGNVLREQALFFRARAYKGKGDKDKACGDLLILIKNAKDRDLQKQSLDLYKKWGGDPVKLMPGNTPEVAWQDFVASAQKGDMDTCMKATSGEFKKLLQTATGGDPDDLRDSYTDTTFTFVRQRLGTDKETGKAWVHLNINGTNRGIIIGLLLDKKNGRWTIDNMKMAPGKKKPVKKPDDKPVKK